MVLFLFTEARAVIIIVFVETELILLVNFEAFRENLFSVVSMLGGTPGGGLSRFPSGSLAAMTGLPYAGENYALFNSLANGCEVAEALDFFGCRNVPFVVPELPEVQLKLAPVLESNGLCVKSNYTAMALDAEAGYVFDPAAGEVGEAECDMWAEAAWFGFGGEAPMPESYRDFARYLLFRHENRLFVLQEEGRALCCGLLHNSRMACGLYYFATLPQFRRRGLARRLMNSLAAAAAESHRLFILLATEEGLPFYRDFGFAAMRDIPLRSLSDI